MDADGDEVRRGWLKKAQLSEVCEDAEQSGNLEEATAGEAGASNISDIINAKIVTKRWKRKAKEAPGEDHRRDSSLVGVFSAIRLSTKWKEKMSQKKLDDEGKSALKFRTV